MNDRVSKKPPVEFTVIAMKTAKNPHQVLETRQKSEMRTPGYKSTKISSGDMTKLEENLFWSDCVSGR